MTRALLGRLAAAAMSGTLLGLSSLPSYPSQTLAPSPSDNSLSDFPSSTSLNGSIGEICASGSFGELLDIMSPGSWAHTQGENMLQAAMVDFAGNTTKTTAVFEPVPSCPCCNGHMACTRPPNTPCCRCLLLDKPCPERTQAPSAIGQQKGAIIAQNGSNVEGTDNVSAEGVEFSPVGTSEDDVVVRESRLERVQAARVENMESEVKGLHADVKFGAKETTNGNSALIELIASSLWSPPGILLSRKCDCCNGQTSIWPLYLRLARRHSTPADSSCNKCMFEGIPCPFVENDVERRLGQTDAQNGSEVEDKLGAELEAVGWTPTESHDERKSFPVNASENIVVQEQVEENALLAEQVKDAESAKDDDAEEKDMVLGTSVALFVESPTPTIIDAPQSTPCCPCCSMALVELYGVEALKQAGCPCCGTICKSNILHTEEPESVPSQHVEKGGLLGSNRSGTEESRESVGDLSWGVEVKMNLIQDST